MIFSHLNTYLCKKILQALLCLSQFILRLCNSMIFGQRADIFCYLRVWPTLRARSLWGTTGQQAAVRQHQLGTANSRARSSYLIRAPQSCQIGRWQSSRWISVWEWVCQLTGKDLVACWDICLLLTGSRSKEEHWNRLLDQSPWNTMNELEISSFKKWNINSGASVLLRNVLFKKHFLIQRKLMTH